MGKPETLGGRIRRIRQERGMSLAKVCGADFSRAFLNQVELGKSQPSTRVLRVIAGRLDTEVDYLLEGRQPHLEHELALEKARVLVARGEARRALLALRPVLGLSGWPLAADVLLCQAEALFALDQVAGARIARASAARLSSAHRDRHRRERLRAIETGTRFSFAGDPVLAHLRLADRAQRVADPAEALEHYRAARILLESGPLPRVLR
ncbi:MAG TPA: helix-turn-helix transcriptional regulator [Patescibacteria group bacterium]|nr:helix-turn-helix transcriptional regulator [Patescibacteria group bacterium]